MKVTLKKFYDLVSKYNLESIDKVRKAYEYAEKMHEGQFRKSGEPYIIHTLNVP